MRDTEHESPKANCTVGEVSEMTGLTRQRVRQLCAEGRAAGSPGFTKDDDGGWLISLDRAGKILLEQTKRKRARAEKISGASDPVVRLIAESCRFLANALNRLTDELYREVETLRSENRMLREELRRLSHSESSTGSTAESPRLPVRERPRDEQEEVPRRRPVRRPVAEGRLYPDATRDRWPEDDLPEPAPPEIPSQGAGRQSPWPDGVRKRRDRDPGRTARPEAGETPDYLRKRRDPEPPTEDLSPTRNPRDRNRKIRKAPKPPE